MPSPDTDQTDNPWLRPLLGVPMLAWIAFVGFADLMLAFPGIDLWVSRQFYAAGDGFHQLGQWWERLGYRSVSVLMWGSSLGLIGLWLYNRRSGRRLLGLDGRRLAFLLLLLALVPGLLVNQVLKEHWGRARPVQVAELGGSREFTPAFVLSDQGGGAFSSGHVAAACYLIAVAVVLTGPRSPWVLAAVLYALLVALARLAAGGHFASDIVTSAFLVLIGYWMLRRWLLPAGRGADTGRQV